MAFYTQSFIYVPSLSSPLLLRNHPNTSALIPIPPMSPSSRNRSNSKAFRHIMPCVASVCEGMHYHKTGVPWHTKSTRIIVFSPLKLPWNAVFCKILSAFQGIVVFFSFTTFFAKKCKMKQITSICSSQIVVSLGGADYCSNKFPNLINLLISLKCSAKIFLHFNHLTALHEHPYPIL